MRYHKAIPQSVLNTPQTNRSQAGPSLGVVLKTTDVAIVGAGPYGLSLAAHLRHRRCDFRIFGDPLVFWRRMLPQTMLKSPDFGSNIYTPEPGNSFVEWCDARSLSREEPIPMSRFTAYLVDTQRRLLPMVESTLVTRVRRADGMFELALADGERLRARRVVVAVGLAPFPRTPPVLGRLPQELVSHTSDHAVYEGWSGREVCVVGAGQSALEAADALVESGANVTVLVRAPRIIFTSEYSGRPRPLRHRLRRPRTAMGESLLSYAMQHVPLWPHFLPDRARLLLLQKHLGPYATWWLRRVTARASLVTSSEIVAANGRESHVELRIREAAVGERTLRADHVVAGTGFEVDVTRLAFLHDLAPRLARIGGAPRLSMHFESSISGLFFVGPAAAPSFGPFFRFVCGAEYVAPALASHLADTRLEQRFSALSSWAK